MTSPLIPIEPELSNDGNKFFFADTIGVTTVLLCCGDDIKLVLS